MIRSRSRSRVDGLPARLASVCIGLLALSLVLAAGVRAPAPLPRSAPSAESPGTAALADAVIDGLATASPARPPVAPAGARPVGAVFAALALSGLIAALAVRARRLRRTPAVLDDVGDRWRALLIGAPPALSSL